MGTHDKGAPIDMQERLALCDLFDELGPDAPTLCEGWTTADLAAHLVLREHFSRWDDERRAAEKSKGMPELVGRLRAGAPLVPWRIPGVRTVLNGMEYLIHHEDARRANGAGPREDRPDLQSLALRWTGLLGRRLAHQVRSVGLELRTPDGSVKTYGSGGAVIVGEPVELLLYLNGRRSAAHVQLSGSADAIAAVEAANLLIRGRG
jgi:uncharacterized protein (TIGR03085 family)